MKKVISLLFRPPPPPTLLSTLGASHGNGDGTMGATALAGKVAADTIAGGAFETSQNAADLAINPQ